SAKLVDMIFSVNGEIILMSRHFKFSTYSIVILSVCTILLNLALIPKYGMSGAGLASLLSIIIYNLVKMIYVKWKFGMQPFSLANIYLLLIGLTVYFVAEMAHPFDEVIPDLLFTSTLVTILFGGSIYLLRISPDINQFIHQLFKRIFKS
ncbi:MAG: polysaccharide biosynthesis C-terminal domain-containing protein, partial [Cyclobacteriaceae bacterium]